LDSILPFYHFFQDPVYKTHKRLALSLQSNSPLKYR
jgi:hypothetical protein